MTPSTLTRRQALRLALSGSVALASTAVALSGPLATTIFAGPSSASVLLLGVRAGPTPAGRGTTAAIPVVVQSMDLVTGQVQTRQVPQLLQDGTTPVLQRNETITGCAVLGDGTLVLAVAPVGGSKHATEPTRLTRLNMPAATTVPIVNLKAQEQLGSVVATAGGTLLALVAKKNGTPPVRLVTLDPPTGTITDHATVHLPKGQRFATLAQCPDGQLYTTGVAPNGDTSLVQLDASKNKPRTVPLLDVDGHVWNNGVASLVCSPTGQLLALGAPRYKTPNALYAVDMRTGAMSRIRDFDVARVTIALK